MRFCINHGLIQHLEPITYPILFPALPSPE